MNLYGRLLELQHLDTLVDRLDRRLADLPEAAALAEAESRAQTLSGAAEQASRRLHDEERAQAKAEQELATLTERLEREREKLMSGQVTSPKELTGLQGEVDSLVRRKDRLEDDLLQQMERVEEAGEQERESARAREAAEEGVRAARTAHDEVRGALVAEREGYVEARAVEVRHLDDELMTRYEKLRGQLRGVAVGMLEDGTCGACHVELSSSELDRISSSSELERCPECRRLLVTERLLKT